MAAGFRGRLAVLTAPKASSYLRRTRHKELSRSRSDDPVVAGLHDSANTLLGWTKAQAPPQSQHIAWIGDGVDRLNRLLAGLTDLLLLHTPQLVQDPQRKTTASSSWTERLLHDLVLLADAHGCFCDMLLSLKQLLAEAQAAVRHRDAVRLAAVLRARRRSDVRGLSALASTLHGLSHRSSSCSSSTTATAALAEAVAAATCAASAASIAIFVGLASASASSALRAMTVASPAEAMELLRNLEERVVAAEDGSEQVLRALLGTRGSLLNVLTMTTTPVIRMSADQSSLAPSPPIDLSKTR